MDWLRPASKYVGIPYGEGEGELRCYELLAAFYRHELGLELPSYAYDPRHPDSMAGAIRRGIVHWREVVRSQAQPTDAVLLWVTRRAHPSPWASISAMGRCCTRARVSAREGQPASPIGAVIEPLGSPFWAPRVVGYYRHESRFDGWTLRAKPHPFKADRVELAMEPGATIHQALLRSGIKRDSDGGKVVVVIGDEPIDEREWVAEHMATFCGRHPDWPDNRNRLEVNGPIRWGRDSAGRVLKKIAKQSLGGRAPPAVLNYVTDLLAAPWPSSRLLPALYHLALGIHLQRRFRRGWASCRPDNVNETTR